MDPKTTSAMTEVIRSGTALVLAPYGDAGSIEGLKNAVANLQSLDRDFLEIGFVTACQEFIAAACHRNSVVEQVEGLPVKTSNMPEFPRGTAYVRTVPVISEVPSLVQGPRTIPSKGPGTG